MRFRPARGYTLVELIVVVALLAVGAAALAPTARRLAERSSVVAAREEVIRSLARARSAAVSAGGSVLTVRVDPPGVRIEAGGGVVRELPLDRAGGIRVQLTGGRDSTTFRFDRLGIGRFASGGMTFRRGEAVAGLVVSSYGRVRRR